MGVQKGHDTLLLQPWLWVTYQQAHIHLTRHDEVDDNAFCVYVCACSSLVRFSLFGSPSKSWSPITTKLGVKDAMGVLSYVNEVKSHVPRSRVI